MDNFYASYPVENGGGSSGVTSLNGLTGALTLVAGAGITITPSGSTLIIASTAGSSWLTAGNALSGGSPSTPAEFFGSNNNFDVIQKRNGVEYERFSSTAVSLGGGSLQYILANQSLQYGITTGSSTILASGSGSGAFGSSQGVGSVLEATNTGSFAIGHSVGGSTINAGAAGSLAGGVATGGGVISALGQGSIVFGYINGSGDLKAAGQGSATFAYASNFSIQGLGAGSFTSGISTNGAITNSGSGAVAMGDALNQTADYGQSFGLGHASQSYLALVAGRYSVTAGTPASWVSTDSLFVLGNGASFGSRANAFQIDKDGKMTSTAAEVNSAVRAASNPDTLSARTDHTLMVDTSVGASPFVVNMPPGEQGLIFLVKDSGNNASVNNINFVPNGGDVMESGSNITTDSGYRQFQFFSGVWYIEDNIPAASNAWNLTGNSLTGGSPSTPAEFIGSLNDYDYIIRRNNLEAARINADGLLVGATSSNGIPAKLQLESTSSGDILYKSAILQSSTPIIDFDRMARATTSGAVTTVLSFPTDTDFNMVINSTVIVKQTGGGTGSVGDSASYMRTTVLSNVGGVLTKIDEQADYTYEIDPAMDFTIGVSGANVTFNFQGVAGRNLSWGLVTETKMITL